MSESYGDLKGASLGVEVEPPPTPNSPNPTSPTSLTSPTLPPLPKSPITTTAATSSTMIPNNSKARLVEFCGKNKLPLPEFKRQSPVQGAYGVKLIWAPADSDETEEFVHSVTRPTKKEAENTVAAELLPRLREWVNNHKQNDIGNVKGDLMLLTQKHPDRLRQPKYTVENIGIAMFSCTLCVADSYTGEEYITTGKAVGKKNAEKEASLAMLHKLTEVLSSSPPEEPGMSCLEKLELRLKTMFPAHTLDFIIPHVEGQKYLLENLILVLMKENTPNIILAHASAPCEEEAKQLCAQFALPHINRIKELVPVEEEQIEVPK